MSTTASPAASPAAAPGDARIGEVLGGRYRLERAIGRGGMGVVYRAVQTNVDRPVAVKLLRADRLGEPASSARFVREARVISELSSPHAVTLIDTGETERGERFLVMELLSGESLSDRLARDGRLPLESAARILDHVACALSEAHDRGVVHRDVKPHNIFLVATAGYREFAKLVDFGVATVDDDELDVTGSTGVPGTPTHLAPERFSGEPARPQADVYALGVVAYQVLNGRPPFVGSSPWALMQQHVSADPPPWESSDVHGASIPEAVKRFVGRCLAKAPELRPKDGAAFREGLRSALRAAGVHALTTGDAPAPPASVESARAAVAPTLDAPLPTPSAPRRPSMARRVALVVAALAAVAVGAVLSLGSDGDASAVAADVPDAPRAAFAPAAPDPVTSAVVAPERPDGLAGAPTPSPGGETVVRASIAPAPRLAAEPTAPGLGPAAEESASPRATAPPSVAETPEDPPAPTAAPPTTVAPPTTATPPTTAHRAAPRRDGSATAARKAPTPALEPAPAAGRDAPTLTPDQARKVKLLLD